MISFEKIIFEVSVLDDCGTTEERTDQLFTHEYSLRKAAYYRLMSLSQIMW